jgi:UDP-glucose 4-epimerase
MLGGLHVVVTGGTGSLGKVLLRRLLSGEMGMPGRVTVFSRDEAKQSALRSHYLTQANRYSTDEIIYENFRRTIAFHIGDVRSRDSVSGVLADADVVFNAAALKQVPTCEYFPHEAVLTNVEGAWNIVSVIRDLRLPVKTVVGISTDKAAKPINVMGMTKALQERVFLSANLSCRDTRFIAVRYGNVLASRGSVIPLFHQQIAAGGPVTLTDPDMTRFLLTLEDAVDVIFAAYRDARAGEIFIPRIPSARVEDIAKALVGDRDIPITTVGTRPGEKQHEILIGEEEGRRAFTRDDDYYVIRPILPELVSGDPAGPTLNREYGSDMDPLPLAEVEALLGRNRLLIGQLDLDDESDLLR